ncbi:MAG: DUF3341 domain-containing protein [Acidobacteriota bacterium]
MSRRPLAAVAGARRLYGLLAELESVEALLATVEGVRKAGYCRFDAHAPIPVHGLDEAMGIRPSRLPLIALGGGAIGALAGLALQWFTNAFDYQLLVSGKPLFALPPAIPVAFELTVLLAALGVFVGLMVFIGLPRLHHPLFASERFRRATSDRFFVSIEADDPRFDVRATRSLLESLGSTHVEEVWE